MISELHDRELQAEYWGNKAARLSTVAGLMPYRVPLALCIRAKAVREQRAVLILVSNWLKSSKARKVLVRSSLADEDGDGASHAGESLTSDELEARPDHITGTLFDFVDRQSSLKLGRGSLIVQQLALGERYGVAFISEGSVIIESGFKRGVITDSGKPEWRAVISAESARWTGDDFAPPVTILKQFWVLSHELLQRFGDGLDVEWVLVCGCIMVVQVRPITRRWSNSS